MNQKANQIANLPVTIQNIADIVDLSKVNNNPFENDDQQPKENNYINVQDPQREGQNRKKLISTWVETDSDNLKYNPRELM